MKKLLFALIFALFAIIANAQLFQIGTYKVTKTKVAGWGITAVGGALDGMLEGYSFDRTNFERKYGADKYGYWGSQSWRNVYNNGNPADGFKSPAHRWLGAWDFYHHADDWRKLGYIGGSIVLGVGGAKSNTKWWHYAADFAVTFALSAATKSAGMAYIRN